MHGNHAYIRDYNTFTFEFAEVRKRASISKVEITTPAIIPHPTSSPTCLYAEDTSLPIVKTIIVSPDNVNVSAEITVDGCIYVSIHIYLVTIFDSTLKKLQEDQKASMIIPE
jgi:hypothetical protein